MKSSRSVITILSFIVLNSCFSQNEANIWYFGWNAGLDFNSGSPIALTDGALHTTEGCSSICDANGDLLFYTDGVSVWTKNHNIMENGSGLSGGSSVSQSALIIKKPDSDSLYYIFTLPDCQDSPTMNIDYSIIDISLNSGLGKLTDKNIFLRTPMTEKVTATYHANGNDIWVISHERDTNTFCSFLVTSLGVSHTPVISNIGSSHSGYDASSVGCLKASPSGNYLACCVQGLFTLELFDFNNVTGEVTNPLTFNTYNTPYGVEFSPNESRLYIAPLYENRLLQFDLLAGSPTDIINSEKVVAEFSLYPGTLQLGPDFKIYLVGQPYTHLTVINNPNELDTTCNVGFNQLSLNDRKGIFGLPNFLSNYFVPVINYENTCFDDSTYFWPTQNYPIQNINWDFGDTATGNNNFSTDSLAVHVFSSSGKYTVTVSIQTVIGVNVYTTEIEIYPGPVSPTFITMTDSVCQGTSNVLFAINSIENTDSIIWNLVPDSAGIIFGSDTIIYINFSTDYSGQTTLQVHGINECCNGDTTSYNINVLGFPVSNAGNDTTICGNNSCTLNGSSQNEDHTYWATLGDGTFNNRFILNATYTPGPIDIEVGYADLILFAYAISPCLGEVGDTMSLIIEEKPIAFAGENDEICEGESHLLSGSADNYSSILWTTSGNGVFDDPLLLTATYFPGTNDISFGMVNLILTAYPNLPCIGEEADTMDLSINYYPQQPQIPEGPIAIDLDATQTSEYTIAQVINATSYEWFLEPYEAGIIDGIDTIGTIYWSSVYVGLYAYVYVVAINDCEESYSDSLAVDISPVGLNLIGNHTKIKVSPNPSNGLFNINIKGLEKIIDLSVIDANGLTFKQEKIAITKNDNNFKLDLSNEPSGIYYLKFIMKDGIVIKKVLVNR